MKKVIESIGEQVPGKYEDPTTAPIYMPLDQDTFHRFYHTSLKNDDGWGIDSYGNRSLSALQMDDQGNLVQADAWAHGLEERSGCLAPNPNTGKYELAYYHAH